MNKRLKIYSAAFTLSAIAVVAVSALCNADHRPTTPNTSDQETVFEGVSLRKAQYVAENDANYTFDASVNIDSDIILNVTLNKSDNKQYITFKDDNGTYEYKCEEYVDNGDTITFAYRAITPQKMADHNHFVIHDGSNTYNADFVLASYLEGVFNDQTSNEATKKLVVAMLNYGTEAQKYNSYNLEFLANEVVLKDTDLENYTYSYDYEGSKKSITLDGYNDAAHFVSSRAIFGTKLGVELAFEAKSDISKENLSLNFDGKSYDITTNTELEASTGYTMYSVVINDFSAVDYSTEHSAYIVNFGFQASHTMKFSINSYLTSRVLNSSEHSNFYKAAYLYGKAAAAVAKSSEIKTETKDPTCEEDGYVQKVYGDYIYEKIVKGKLGHDYLISYDEAQNKYYKICNNDISDKTEFDATGKSISINDTEYTAYSLLNSETIKLSYDANTNKFVIKLNGEVGNLKIDMAGDSDVIVNAETESTVSNVDINNGFRSIEFKGEKLNVNNQFTTEANTCTISNEMNVTTTTEDGINSTNGVVIVNKGATLSLKNEQTDNEKSGIVATNFVNNGTVTVDGYKFGTYLNGTMTNNGDMTFTNCINGILNHGSHKFVNSNGTFKAESSSSALQMTNGEFVVEDGIVTLNTTGTDDTLNIKTLNVNGGELNVSSHNGGGLSSRNVSEGASYNFNGGNVVFKQEGTGNCGFSLNNASDVITVNGASLTIENYERGISAWDSAIGTATLDVLNGSATIVATSVGIYDLKSVTVGGENKGVLNIKAVTHAIYSTSDLTLNFVNAESRLVFNGATWQDHVRAIKAKTINISINEGSYVGVKGFQEICEIAPTGQITVTGAQHLVYDFKLSDGTSGNAYVDKCYYSDIKPDFTAGEVESF